MVEKVEIQVDKDLPGTGVTLINFRYIPGAFGYHTADRAVIWVQNEEEKAKWQMYFRGAFELERKALLEKQKKYKKIIPGEKGFE